MVNPHTGIFGLSGQADAEAVDERIIIVLVPRDAEKSSSKSSRRVTCFHTKLHKRALNFFSYGGTPSENTNGAGAAWSSNVHQMQVPGRLQGRIYA